MSRCLLGDNVRYDGKNTHSAHLTKVINEDFEFYGLCPEVEMGLGIPRETIQLVEVDGKIELLPSSRKKSLTALAFETFKKFQLDHLDGFILQSRSPSCGVQSTKLYLQNKEGEESLVSEHQDGLFASYLKVNFPELPLLDSSKIEESELEEFKRLVFESHKKRA